MNEKKNLKLRTVISYNRTIISIILLSILRSQGQALFYQNVMNQIVLLEKKSKKCFEVDFTKFESKFIINLKRRLKLIHTKQRLMNCTMNLKYHK
jgi:hypothetical protein